MGLRSVARRMLGQQTRQSYRLLAQILANQILADRCLVTFVEEQIERLQDSLQPARQFRSGWDFVRDICIPNPLLRSRQSLCDCGFARQKCMRNFRDAKTAKRLQGQRRLRFQWNLWVTAHEQHPQPVIAYLQVSNNDLRWCFPTFDEMN